MSNHFVIDSEPIEELKRLDPDASLGLLNNLIDMYLKATPELLDDIGEALSSSEFEEMASAAHILKSSSGNLGANEFSKVCEELEALVLNHHPELAVRAQQLYMSLREMLPLVLEKLQQYRL